MERGCCDGGTSRTYDSNNNITGVRLKLEQIQLSSGVEHC